MSYKSIPNLLTLSNGLFGALAVVMYLTHSMDAALVCILVSLLADVLDGMTARLLKATSEIGADLDSLSDAVSFGVAPALLLMMELYVEGWETAWAALLIVPASIYRLGKFNHDPRQARSFLGLATTGNAALVVPLVHYLSYHPVAPTPLLEALFVLLVVADAWLLVSEVPFFGLKQLSRGLRANIGLLVVAVVTIAAVVLCGVVGLSIGMALYVLINLILWPVRRTGRSRNPFPHEDRQ